jgi:hypothetical protein
MVTVSQVMLAELVLTRASTKNPSKVGNTLLGMLVTRELAFQPRRMTRPWTSTSARSGATTDPRLRGYGQAA